MHDHSAEHGVVLAVLVDPRAKAGRAHGECHGSQLAFGGSLFASFGRCTSPNGEANRVRKKHKRAIIAADVRRFGHVSNKDGVLGTHRVLRGLRGCGAPLFQALFRMLTQ
jgi:hypothetical protein